MKHFYSLPQNIFYEPNVILLVQCKAEAWGLTENFIPVISRD